MSADLPALVMIISLVEALNCRHSFALHRRTRMLLHADATPTDDDVISDVTAARCTDDVIVVVVAHVCNSQSATLS